MNDNKQKVSIPIWRKIGIGFFPHYLKFALRNMRKYKTQSLVGIFGLAVAFAIFILGSYWHRYEKNYDMFYPDAKRIRLMVSHDMYATEWGTDVLMPIDLADELVSVFPEIESAGRAFTRGGGDTYRLGENYVPVAPYYVDAAYIDMFTFDYAEGSKMDVVRQWNSFQPTDSMLYCGIVLTESVARKLFGNEPAIGKTLRGVMPSVNTVLAVIRDLPQNSNFQYDVLSSLSFDAFFPKSWDADIINTYIKLKPHINEKALHAKLENHLIDRGWRTHTRLEMMPLENIRQSYEAFLNGEFKTYPIRYGYIIFFVVGGLFLLLCAYLNFMTLSLSRFMENTKELGIRRVFGAKRIQLNSQLLTSLGIEALIALLVSVLLVRVLTPMFSSFVFLNFRFGELAGWLVVCLATGLLFTLLMGLLPVHVINALRVRVRGRNIFWRKLMVTVQLFIGAVYIFSIMVAGRQFSYLQNYDIGFDRKDIVHTYRPSSVIWQTFKAELETHPDILQSTALYMPLFTDRNHSTVEWDGKSGKDSMLLQMHMVDVNFLDFFGIGMLSGNFFTTEQSTGNYTVINQTAARIMGLENPTGHTINMGGRNIQIVGVVNDFHILPLRQPVEPMMLIGWGRRSDVYVRINPVERQRALAYLQETYQKFAASGDLFKYEFLDDEYASFHRSEKALLTVFGIMAVVCLLISAFGIYSMVSLSTLHRRKEIAIRKVMGAEAVDIAMMFFREYLMLVLIACVIALPVAYRLMNRWLQDYAYRVDIAWWKFAAVLALISFIVLATVLGRVLKAANGNPAEVVKSE